MKNKTKGTCFVKFPAALITKLSDTSIRILLYAIDRQGLVTTGTLKKWELSLTDVENQFSSKVHGYSRNTIRNGFKQLSTFQLLEFNKTHYRLNTNTLNDWMLKSRDYEGMPKSGKGGYQNLARVTVPKIGMQEKISLKKNSKREEMEILNTSPCVKTPLEGFDETFGKSISVAPDTFENQFKKIFSEDSAGEAT